MASVGSGNYGVVVMHFGGFNASYIKLVLHREPRARKAWCHAGIVLPNEEHVDAAVRELFKETDLTLTVDDLTMLSGDVVCVP
jgi:ADP-ribose pyrophosphatase YjhB (NUDIX family)